MSDTPSVVVAKLRERLAHHRANLDRWQREYLEHLDRQKHAVHNWRATSREIERLQAELESAIAAHGDLDVDMAALAAELPEETADG